MNAERAHMLNWINSTGGPLILLDRAQLEQWQGGTDDYDSDYNRACSVDDLVGAIAVADRDALVLGGEPHETAWLEGTQGGVLVRWDYADSDESVDQALNSINAVRFADTNLRISVTGECRLIDAVETGSTFTQPIAPQRRRPKASESIVVALQSGTYRVDTGVLETSPGLRLILHKLSRVE